MPCLQLDVPGKYTVEEKKEFACVLGELYADIMATSVSQVTVIIRETEPGSIWRCRSGGAPELAAYMKCDIRRGRTREQRARLAEALVDECVTRLGLVADRLAISFVQLGSDEMFRAEDGGFGKEWTPDEAG